MDGQRADGLWKGSLIVVGGESRGWKVSYVSEEEEEKRKERKREEMKEKMDENSCHHLYSGDKKRWFVQGFDQLKTDERYGSWQLHRVSGDSEGDIIMVYRLGALTERV